MIAIITLVIVAVQFAIVMMILMGGKSARVRTDKVVRDNNAARTHIKAELAEIKSFVLPDNAEDEWRELTDEGRDDLPL